MKKKTKGSIRTLFDWAFTTTDGLDVLGVGISDDESHAHNGFSILSGDNDVEGNFYGIMVITSPTTLNITPRQGGLVDLNGTNVTASVNMTSYFPESVYIPIPCTKVDIDDGIVLVFKK